MYNIVVVDDEPGCSELVRRIFESDTIKVKCFNDPLEAVGYLCDHVTVDALITDIEMRQCDGFELAKKVRLAKPALPILYYSGSFFTLPKDRPNEAYLQKPFCIKELRRKVSRLIEGV